MWLSTGDIKLMGITSQYNGWTNDPVPIKIGGRIDHADELVVEMCFIDPKTGMPAWGWFKELAVAGIVTDKADPSKNQKFCRMTGSEAHKLYSFAPPPGSGQMVVTRKGVAR